LPARPTIKQGLLGRHFEVLVHPLRPCLDVTDDNTYYLEGMCAMMAAKEIVSQPTYPKTMSVCSTEPCIEACQAEEGRITGFAFAHSLWIAICDFHVGLPGSVDEFIFVKYIWDIDLPLFTGSIYES